MAIWAEELRGTLRVLPALQLPRGGVAAQMVMVLKRLSDLRRLRRHASCTRSAPSRLLPHRHRAVFVDGGVWSNCPAPAAVIEAMTALDQDRKDIDVLSIGTTTTPFHATERQRSGSLFGWGGSLVDLFGQAQVAGALGQTKMLTGKRAVRVDEVVTPKRFIALTDEGLVVFIRKSKTDQSKAGRKIGVPYGTDAKTCPVRAVLGWIDEAELEDGPLFRPINKHGDIQESRLTGDAVPDIVRRAMRAAGLNDRGFSAHSLRAGLITQAAMSGVSERAIQEQSGHKSLLVMRRYIRDGSLFRENAAAKVGL